MVYHLQTLVRHNYCSQFLLIFFLKLLLGIGQAQSIDNISKNYFHFSRVMAYFADLL